MSLGIDPVVSNVLFTLNLIPHLRRVGKTTGLEGWSPHMDGFPYVSVIVALYREGVEDINATLSSLASQSYPRHLFEVLVVVEPDDAVTLCHLEPWPRMLLQAGVASRVIYSDGQARSKPHALNIGLRQARGEYCVFYDGADRIDPDQIVSGVSVMMNEGSDVAQARVLREGPSLLSHFLLFDTALWYWKYLPLLLRYAGGFPLSGEGLFLKRQALAEVGGFPEVLTEDALLGLTFLEKGKRFSLVDSNVVERAPSRARGHFKQKLRWHRGYLTCLRKLLFSLRIPLRKKFILLLPFSVPICSALGFIGWTLILSAALIWTTWRFEAIDFSPWASPVYTRIVYYWALFLAFFGIPFSIFSSARALMAARGKLCVPLLLLMPLYWMFVGFCALCSFFRGTDDWGKTDRGQPPGSGTEEAATTEPAETPGTLPSGAPSGSLPQPCGNEATVSSGTPDLSGRTAGS